MKKYKNLDITSPTVKSAFYIGSLSSWFILNTVFVAWVWASMTWEWVGALFVIVNSAYFLVQLMTILLTMGVPKVFEEIVLDQFEKKGTTALLSTFPPTIVSTIVNLVCCYFIIESGMIYNGIVLGLSTATSYYILSSTEDARKKCLFMYLKNKSGNK
jgi:hypothetical protein